MDSRKINSETLQSLVEEQKADETNGWGILAVRKFVKIK